MAVERMQNCANVSALAGELEIDRAVLYHWQRVIDTPEPFTCATASVTEGDGSHGTTEIVVEDSMAAFHQLS
jgi:hypothetical protein